MFCTLAREFGQQSPLGAYLNELCDIVADSALILPFAMISRVDLLIVLLVTLLALFSEYEGVLGPMVGASRRYGGPMGKSDRALVLGVLATGIALGRLSANWIKVKLYVPVARRGLALMRMFCGNFFVNSYVKARLLSHARQTALPCSTPTASA